MDMIERVARAICLECGDQPYDALPEAATYIERKTHPNRAIMDKQEARHAARAAIEAMRDPPDNLVNAAMGRPPSHKETPMRGLCFDFYNGVIDAALSDSPPPQTGE